MSAKPMIVSEKGYIVAEHVLNPAATLEEIIAFVRSRKSIGELKYCIYNGGIRSVVLTERKEVTR